MQGLRVMKICVQNKLMYKNTVYSRNTITEIIIRKMNIFIDKFI